MMNIRTMNVKFLMLVLLLCVSQPVFAQKVTEQFKKPLKSFELTPKKEFLAETDLISETMAQDETMSYQIRVPKNWKKSDKNNFDNIVVSDRILAELGKYFGPPALNARSRIEVEAAGLEYQMSAEQWIMQYLLHNGYNSNGMKVHDTKRAEALYVLIEDGDSLVVRAVAQINGPNVLFAQYFVPVERYHEEKATQVRVLDSFQPTKVSNKLAQEMKTFQFLDLATMQYPETWTLRTLPIRSIDRMKLEILNTVDMEDVYLNVTTRLDGQVDVEMVSVYATDTLEEEIERYKASMAERGLILGEHLETRDDFLFGDRFDFVDANVYRLTDENNRLTEFEGWITVMSAGEYYYFISLVTASRDQDYALWARNSETYKLMASLVEPNLSIAEE